MLNIFFLHAPPPPKDPRHKEHPPLPSASNDRLERRRSRPSRGCAPMATHQLNRPNPRTGKRDAALTKAPTQPARRSKARPTSDHYWPSWAGFGPTWADFCKTDGDFDQHWPTSVGFLAGLGQVLTDLGHPGPNLALSGPSLAEIGRCWSNLANMWSTFGQLRSMFCPTRPMLPDFGPNLGSRVKSCTTVAQLFRNSSRQKATVQQQLHLSQTVRQLRRSSGSLGVTFGNARRATFLCFLRN